MPLLSIITITYNAEKFLERTLKSVAAAWVNGAVIEYLVIDGASKDATLAIADSYSFVTKIYSEPDAGLYDAMNKGLAKATGDYVWFLNAGDEAFDSETIRNLLENIKTQKADVFYSDALIVNNDGSVEGLRSVVTPHRLPARLQWQDMKFGMKVCHQAFITKRSICPPYDITNLSADIDWEIECLKKSKKTLALDFILCKYLTGGLSVQKHRRSLIDRFWVLSKHFGFLRTVFYHSWIVLRSLGS